MDETYNVEIVGVSPLLMNRFDGENYGVQKKSGTKEDLKKEAERGLYLDKGKLCQPGIHIESGLTKMAVNYRIPGQGKKTFKDAFKGGVFVSPELIPHKFQNWSIDTRSVVINRGRVMKSRPILEKWGLSFKITCIDERITPAILKQVLVDMGKYNGLGDFRPRYGRFKVKSFEKHKSRNKS